MPIRLLSLLVIGVLAASPAQSTQHSERLSAEQLRALYTDTIIEGEHRRKNFRFRSHYQSSGDFYSYRPGDAEPRAGTWWTKGDEMCIHWRVSDEQYCRHVYRDSSGRYRKSLVKRSGKEVDVVRYDSFVAASIDELKPF